MEHKMEHVRGPDKRGYCRFQANMNVEMAQRMNALLRKIKARFPKAATMSAAWCVAMEWCEEVLDAQDRNEHALDLLDSYDVELVVESVRRDLRMALTGCLTATTKDFTGELSQEYIERYRDE